MRLIMGEFKLVSIVSVNGRSKVGPKTIDILFVVILFTSEFKQTKFKNSNKYF